MSITSADFVEIAEDVFDEYLPKVSASKRADFLEALIGELRDRGLDIEATETESAGIGNNLFDDPEAF